MTTPDDLTGFLAAAADRVPRTPGDPTRAIAAGTRRRRRRRAAGALGAVVIAVGAGIGVATMVDDEGPDVATADDAAPDPAPSSGSTDDSTAPPPTLPPDSGADLAWREASVPSGFWPSSAAWAGDGFVALGWNSSGAAVFRSADGSDWSALDGGPSFDSAGLAADGAGLVTWGTQWPDGPGDGGIPARPGGAVATSDDGGTTWTMLDPLPAPVDVDDDRLIGSTSVTHATRLGDTVIAAVATSYEPDVEAILTDAGIPFDPAWGYGSSMSHGIDGTTFELSACVDAACETEIRYSAEELGLDPAEVELLAGSGPDMTLQRSVAGGPWEPATPPGLTGYVDALVAADGVMVVSTSGETGSQAFRSTDGSTWAPVAEYDGAFPLVSGGDALYGLTWEGRGANLRRYDVAADSWAPIEIGAVTGLLDVAAGPAGLVVGGQLQDPVVFDPVTIEKDGYAITWAPDRFSVTEIDTGAVILDYGPEDLDADEPPDNVVEREPTDGESGVWGLTVLHPDTGEPLVTLDEDDLAPLVSVEEGPTDPVESFLGWSPDGVGWGWQTTTEAFGDTAWVRYVVGDGVVLALVEPLDGDSAVASGESVATATTIVASDTAIEDTATEDTATESAAESSTRVFVATVG